MGAMRVRNAFGSKMASSCSALSAAASGSASMFSRKLEPATAFWISPHTRMALRCTITYASSRVSPAFTSASSTLLLKISPRVRHRLCSIFAG